MERNQSSFTDPFLNPVLYPVHIDYCAKRGLSFATAKANRLASVGKHQTEHMLRLSHPSKSNALGIPYIGYGELTWRLRFDEAPTKGDRWRMAKGEGVRPYLPLTLSNDFYQDVTQPISILEGPIKALSSCDAGVPAIALGGVDTGHDSAIWQEKKIAQLHPELLARIKWYKRLALITYDGNRRTNPCVALGEARYALCLKNAGAIVRAVDIPVTPGGEGPDDYIVYAGAEAYRQRVAEAKPVDPYEIFDLMGNMTRDAAADWAYLLLDSLPFLAALHLGGAPLIAKTQEVFGPRYRIGIGKRHVTEQVTTFRTRLAGAEREAAGDASADEQIEQINRDHAIVFTGGTGSILWEYPSRDFPGRTEARFHKEADFRLKLKNQQVWRRTGKEDKLVDLADYWMSHPARRYYKSIVFEPCKEMDPDVYNLWQGWNCAESASSGDWSLFREHIYKNIAHSRLDVFLYLLEWMADAVQNPTLKTGIVVALRGKQGTGKSFFCQQFGKMYGPHFLTVASSHHLTGTFNGHLANCLLLFADEAFWAGDKSAEGKFKSLITDHKHLIENKGKDSVMVNNYIRVVMSTNSDWVAPVSPEERRFAVFDVGDGNMQDGDFFDKCAKQMDEGGRDAFFHFLRNWKLGTVNLRKIPATEAQADQKIRSMTPLQGWWLNCLQRGYVHPNREWTVLTPSEEVYASYLEEMESIGARYRAPLVTMRTELLRLCTKTAVSERSYECVFNMHGGEIQSKKQRRCYQFPALDVCRQEFSILFRSNLAWDQNTILEQETLDLASISAQGQHVLRAFGYLPNPEPPPVPPAPAPPPAPAGPDAPPFHTNGTSAPEASTEAEAPRENGSYAQAASTAQAPAYEPIYVPAQPVAQAFTQERGHAPAIDPDTPYEPKVRCVQCGGVAIDDRNGYCIRHVGHFQRKMAEGQWFDYGRSPPADEDEESAF